MKFKQLSLTLILLTAILLGACGPSPEQVATMTASAWTPTPKPTSTPPPTPTATPLPYDLTVKVTDTNGNPIAGALVIVPGAGNKNIIEADASGQAAWMDINNPKVSITVTAQGYLESEQGATLERGLNEFIVKMERDPFGLLPAEACAAGESLLYIEDFQDLKTEIRHYNNGPSSTPLGPVPDETANIVLIHDFTTPPGDFSSWYNQTKAGESVEFGDAVWRMKFMITQETDWWLGWQKAGPNDFTGITTSESSYGIYFNTGRHTGITRNVWDSNGQPIPNAGLGRVDNVLILKPDVWHFIEISSYQGRLQVWLDGKLAVEVLDATPLPSGGFDIGRGNTGIMYFDAISVCELSAPFTSSYVAP